MSQTIYVEEENIGLNLVLALIDPSNKKYYAISEKFVISYEVESGKRLKLMRHLNNVIGLHLINGKLLSITTNGELLYWDLESGNQLCQLRCSSTNFLNYNLLWSYECENNAIFVLGTCADLKMDKETSPLSDMSDETPQKNNITNLFRLEIGGGHGEKLSANFKLVAQIDEQIKEKRHLAVSMEMLALCSGKKLTLIPLEGTRVNGPLSFFQNARFDAIEDRNLIVYDGVHLMGDSLYASLSMGRIYIWSRIRQTGLDHNNKIFLNATNTSLNFTVSPYRSVFTGDDECVLAKWNLNTSGAGRWFRAEYLELEAPLDSMILSGDATILVVRLADNSLVAVKTSKMVALSRAQVLHTPWTDLKNLWRAGLNMDPAQPDYIVTNARCGHIQWIDPVKWRTVGMLDVCEENSPPRDNISSSNFLWMDVYLIWFTTSRFVTCEARRNNTETNYIKFYNRLTLGSITDIKLEECISCSTTVKFIRSNLDEVLHPDLEQIDGQEFLRIDINGNFDIYVYDKRRSGKWRLDVTRSERHWNHSRVLYCSKIRSGYFATINLLDKKTTSLLLWQFERLNVLEFTDTLKNVTQVEWAPPHPTNTSPLLLIVCDFGVTAYSPETHLFIWKVAQNGISLFVNLFTSFVYAKERVVQFDSINGEVLKSHCFRSVQDTVVMTGNPENIRFSGLSKQGLSVLKPDNEINAILCELTVPTKKTPFSEYAKRKQNANLKTNGMEISSSPQKLHTAISTEFNNTPNKNLNGESQFLVLQTRIPEMKKFFDGPAYTLAPISQIAPIFVRACLLKRKQEQ